MLKYLDQRRPPPFADGSEYRSGYIQSSSSLQSSPGFCFLLSPGLQFSQRGAYLGFSGPSSAFPWPCRQPGSLGAYPSPVLRTDFACYISGWTLARCDQYLGLRPLPPPPSAAAIAMAQDTHPAALPSPDGAGPRPEAGAAGPYGRLAPGQPRRGGGKEASPAPQPHRLPLFLPLPGMRSFCSKCSQTFYASGHLPESGNGCF